MLAIMVCTNPLNGGINGWLLLLNLLLIATMQSKINSQCRFWLQSELLGNKLIPKINMFFNKSKLSVTVICFAAETFETRNRKKRLRAMLEVHDSSCVDVERSHESRSTSASPAAQEEEKDSWDLCLPFTR